MSIKQGATDIVDRYVGGNLVERVYRGSDLVFDAYTEVSGSLPLSFNARAAHALKDYRIYGTAAGAGTQTENLLSMSALLSAPSGRLPGAVTDADHLLTLTVAPNTVYTVLSTGTGSESGTAESSRSVFAGIGAANAVFRDHPIAVNSGSAGKISVAFYSARSNGAQYISGAAFVSVIPGDHTQDGTQPVPYGYKIPLSISDGTNTSDYDVFIGDTKLGEEEYLDFGEQMVYKRTENLCPRTVTTHSSRLLNSDGTEKASSYWLTTDYIPVSGRIFTLTPVASNSLSAAICAYDDNKTLIKGQTYGSVTDTPYNVTIECDSDVSYIRFCFYTKVMSKQTIMLVSGSTAPSTYIPYLQPADPLAPLPAISAYKGENTLASTETVGNVMVKGRISETTQ